MINQFKDKYTKLITDLNVIDENDPITPSTYTQINDILNNLHQHLVSEKSDLKKIKNNYEKKNNHTTKKYNKKVESINSVFEDKLTKNHENYSSICDEIRDKLDTKKEEFEYDIQQLELDHTFYTSSIEQGKMILFDDFLKNRKRYDYQLEKAKFSYSQVVAEKNVELEKIINETNKSYMEKSLQFKKENVNSTIKIQDKINETQKELDTFHDMMILEKNSLKEKYRKESTVLNENIKKIIKEKNDNLDITKNEYSQTLNNMNLEKEDKKANIHTRSQAILKEFVTKINNLDEETNNLKEAYDDIILKYKREYYEKNYINTNKYHEELATLQSSTIEKKYINRIIKIKNKQFNSSNSALKKEIHNKLHEITKDYLIKLNEIKTNIALLEIDKNFRIKSLNDEEQFNNKYYQEKANIYENDYNLYVKNINIDFNKKANAIKLRSEKRIKLLERNHTGIDANYAKKIETLNAKINKLKQELEHHYKLEKLYTTYEENNFNNKNNLNKANNLLDIEKNKLLKEYNESRYNYYVNELELDKNFGLKKIDLENNFYEINKNYQIKGIKLEIEKITLASSFDMKKSHIYEIFNERHISIVNENSNIYAIEKYINTLKENTLFYLSLIKSCAFQTLKKIFTSYEQVITIFKEINIDDSNYKYIDKILYSFGSIFNELIIDYFKQVISLIDETTNEKLNFIHNFKYKKQFDKLKNDFVEIQQKYKAEKEDLIIKIDMNDKTIENVKNKIFTLINDNEMLESNHKFSKNKKNESSEYKLIIDNQLKIQDYKEKIEQLTKFNKSSYYKLNENSKIIKEIILEYKQKKNEIKKKKYFDTKVFIEFKKSTSSIIDKIISFSLKFNKLFNNEIDKTSKLNKKIFNYTSYFEAMFSKISLLLSYSIDKYEKNIKKENELRKNINKNNHAKQIEIYNKDLNLEILKFEKDYQATIEKQNCLIEENQYNINANKKYYDKLINEAKQNYKNEVNNLKLLYMKQTDDFYKKYYALNANAENINNYHNAIFQSNKENYKNQKIILTNNKNFFDNKIDDNLRKLINDKNEEIQNLPIIYKNTSKNLEKATKKMNKDLSNELRLTKNKHYSERKNLDKIILDFKNQLEALKMENQYNLDLSIKNEEQNSKNSLNQAIKAIKIDL